MSLKKILFASLFALSASVAYSVPAKPGLITMTQSDGSEINVRLIGDEFFHYYLTEDGYLLTTRDGNFYYADIDASGAVVTGAIKAAPATLRSPEARAWLSRIDRTRVVSAMDAGRQKALASSVRKMPARTMDPDGTSGVLPGRIPGSSFPSTGRQKGLVILVNYKDVKMSTADAHNYFSRMLNEPGFSDNGGTGSARDFFVECSDGKFLPEFDVYGPVELPHERSYYGGNNPFTGDDRNAHEMIIDACRLLDDEVDFSEYDRNGDGYIDNVFVFYAGRGEANGGGDDTVWPHSWQIEAGGKGTYVFDGVVLDSYACSNEQVRDRTDGVGTFIHEFSHVMGLPDLYSTNGGSAFTPGSWSALDYGPYNNDGRTPPLYGAFERCALGWMTPNEITGPLSAVLEPISSNRAGVIRTSSANEFFLFENRQQTGWDTYIPGHGMLVWHVHYVSSAWTGNSVNNNPTHQYVDLEEADGIRSASTLAGDAFPGTAGITEFTESTTPSMGTWSGEKLELPVTDITETPDGLITFNVAGGAEGVFPTTEAYEATDVTYNSMRVSWKEVEDARYAVTLFDAATMQPVRGYDKLRVGSATSVEFTGLEPDTEYAYTVFVGNDWQFGEPSGMMRATTRPFTLDLRQVEALSASDVTETSFTASWESLPGVSDYLLSVYSHTSPETDVADCDFTGKTIADGWTTSFDPEYSPNATFSGNEVPALTFKKGGQTLISPDFNRPVALIKFWILGTKVDDTNNVTVSVRVADEWVVVAECPLVKTQGGKRITLTDIPAGADAVKFEYVRGTSFGNLYLDDIHIECHEPIENVYVDGYDHRPLGTETSWSVTDLTPGTTYYYIVDATDGSLSAITSREISVTLQAGSGVIDIAADGGEATFSAGRGVIDVHGLIPGENVIVSDLLGRTVASVRASGSTLTIAVAPGLYIARSSSANAVKLLVK